MDSDAIPREWIGKPVDVYLTNPEAEAIEISATLDEVREGGIRISHIGDIGQGPTMFCPWDSVRNVRSQTPENPPFGEDEFGMLLPYGEPEDEADVPERLREPSAQTLERVVPVAQKLTVGGISVAIASLELYENGLGMLRWQISFEESPIATWRRLRHSRAVVRDPGQRGTHPAVVATRGRCQRQGGGW